MQPRRLYIATASSAANANATTVVSTVTRTAAPPLTSVSDELKMRGGGEAASCSDA
jgi:hypothetical protein